ncbi:hypothetical protein AtDm6_2623 [Acetobacter tropicalis]|uniref:Uncharacterized protein n=1 Tax=Acetobacter tropicalis TaxID=104102 RepID=A0A094YJA5_9PROT|nr:hypothetical protein AtDm6_2623 [Acetobacter tropicalis]
MAQAGAASPDHAVKARMARSFQAGPSSLQKPKDRKQAAF